MSDNQKPREQVRQELIAFMQEKGFVWGPSPEIYGGMAGFYTYGPLGKLLKNKVERVIRDVFIRNDFWEVECPTVMQKEVWEASGHLGGFSDPVMMTKSGATYRIDNLIEETFPDMQVPKTDEELLKFVQEKKLKAPNGEEFIPEVKRHNLMMQTTIGLDTEAYNRPETATTTYLPFMRYVDFFRKKLPFGVFQIGKAYRNEISPRQYMLRMREFTQAEAQLFIFEEDKQTFESFDAVKEEIMPFWSAKTQEAGKTDVEKIPLEKAMTNGYVKNKAYAFGLRLAYNLFVSMGIPQERIRLRQHMDDEKAFYADDAWDVEVNLNTFGWTELCGVHDRTDYDLKQHAKFSGKELVAQREDGGKAVPHVIEIAFGVDRPLFALLDNFYAKKEKDEGKSIFAVPYHMAPVDVAVFPLVKKGGLKEKAHEVYQDLSREFLAVFDIAGSIGRRYQRVAEQGVPYAVTIDFDTIEKGTCTIRDRDSEEQKVIKLDDLKETLHGLIHRSEEFSSL
ncbi:MAG: glycine--tRNA ligase [Nanoarchaeota archaeon]